MLARDYDNYAWEEQRELEYEQPAPRQARQPQADSHKLLRRKIFVLMAIVMAAYFACVVRSEAMVRYGNELVALKQQEAQLINTNNELQIEVEKLKGPERIIGIAEKKLGLSVARSNIYVKAAPVKGQQTAYALANK